MASLIIMLFAVFSLFIAPVRPSGEFWKLDCPSSSVAIAGQTTVIRCYFKDISEITIVAVFLTKDTQEEPIFQMYKEKKGNPRFSLQNQKMGPSLQISGTMFSDEGKYLYRVVTDRGEKEVQLSISVTAKYKDPITSTWPEKVTEGGPVSLYCNATDGYPAGFIHWFDRSGSNWTVNSEMIKTNKDSNGVKSVTLSSKLTFKTIDFSNAPFRCIVYNSKYVQDGESTLEFQSAISGSTDSSGSNTTNIVAGVMVIGSLIVGLLFALLFFRKKKDNGRRPSAHPILNYERGKAAEDDVESGDNSSED